MMQSLPTVDLFDAGQSPWLDFISREILNNGELRGLIEEKGLKGVTSNPSIFEKAMSKPGVYDADIKKMAARGLSAFKIYDALAIADIQRACDLFLPVYEETRGEHGFVSLEVEPGLARKTEETLKEARRLFKAVGRPNVMIKIPATPEGIPAIEAAISEGINVNVTLMFSMRHYQDVAFAYIRGLKKLRARKGDLKKVRSVASVFVSRIDTLIDKKLENMAAENPDVLNLQGKAAVANSKLIYQEFLRIFESHEFASLQMAGANVQQVLWGSTSTKNPDYCDLMYVQPLVGRHTVNTMPQNTLEALLDHGRVRPGTVEEGVEEARRLTHKLKELGIDLLEVGAKLQDDGVQLFADAFDGLLRVLELKKMQLSMTLKGSFGSFSYQVPASIEKAFLKKSAELQKKNFLPRLLQKDATVWKNDPAHKAVIDNRLGWLRAHEWISGKLHEIDSLAAEVRKDGIRDLVLLGMGGSSLAPEVMSLICGGKQAVPAFYMLDTTDPDSILKVEKKINLKNSLFIVASKSGGTVETASQYKYFYDRVTKAYGPKACLSEVGRHFIAITDAGSGLQKNAREKMFRKIFINPTDIGGRYSALSFFGLVPAALIGINIRAILKSAHDLFTSFANERELHRNPAFAPGIMIAVLAKAGIDKLTLAGDLKLSSFGAWLEQLIAESTGKEGKGIVPVDSEPLLAPESYGKDRVFLFLGNSPEFAVFKRAGLPCLKIDWPAPSAIGAEFLRWEISTAVAGAVLGINPFDEPNVKESKDATATVLDRLQATGKLTVKASAPASANLKVFLQKMQAKGYVVLLPYTERSASVQKAFNKVRTLIASAHRCPVLLGFGPRYLHSIGQLYKGGPRTGLFVQFFNSSRADMKVPGEFYTFSQLKTAQALGDRKALESKGLPVLCVDLGREILSGIKVFEQQASKFLETTSANKKK